MPRKGNIAKRDVLADPVYNSKLVTKLINHLMIDGKKAKASSILYDAFGIIQDKTGKEPVEVFEEAMNNVMPVLEVVLTTKSQLKFVQKEELLLA